MPQIEYCSQCGADTSNPCGCTSNDWMIKIVPIELVNTCDVYPTRANSYFVRKMVDVLNKQGQIEPLQVKANPDGTYTPYEQDAWSDPMILAARQLKWPTMLIGITDVYED